MGFWDIFWPVFAAIVAALCLAGVYRAAVDEYVKW
jgi:hypothetical protein